MIIRNFRYPVAKDYTKHAVFEFCEKMNKSLTALNDPFKKDDSQHHCSLSRGTTLNPLPDYSSFFDNRFTMEALLLIKTIWLEH